MQKLKHLTAQFADETVEYTIKGISKQYELLECAIKANQCNMNSEYSNSKPIKLRKSLCTILCHKIKTDSLKMPEIPVVPRKLKKLTFSV